jgi:hypothetical protein
MKLSVGETSEIIEDESKFRFILYYFLPSLLFIAINSED